MNFLRFLGKLTRLLIYYHLENMVTHYCDNVEEYCDRLYSYLRKNLAYIRDQLVSEANVNDIYWNQVSEWNDFLYGNGIMNSSYFDPKKLQFFF